MDTAFITIIKKIIVDRGNSILDNIPVFNSLVADYAKGEYTRERRLLIQELKAGHRTEVLAKMQNQDKPPEMKNQPMPNRNSNQVPKPIPNHPVKPSSKKDDKDDLDEYDDFDDDSDIEDDFDNNRRVNNSNYLRCEWCGKKFRSGGVRCETRGGIRYFCCEKCCHEATDRIDCFITTATCRMLNKTDDCRELTSFRNFRDSFMQETAEMQDEIKEYYHLAPKICAEIEKKDDLGAHIYMEIWTKYLCPALLALDRDEKQKAHDIYKQMVLDLKEVYLHG